MEMSVSASVAPRTESLEWSVLKHILMTQGECMGPENSKRYVRSRGNESYVRRSIYILHSSSPPNPRSGACDQYNLPSEREGSRHLCGEDPFRFVFDIREKEVSQLDSRRVIPLKL